MHQFVTQRFNFARKTTAHLVHGRFAGCFRIGMDQVGYGFGLGQVEFAIEKGPLGEFPRLCQAGAIMHRQHHNLLHDVHRAVTGYFYDIFFGKRARRLEEPHHHFINDGFTIANGTDMQRVAWLFSQVFAIKHFIGNGNGLLTRQTDDGQGAYALRSGQGYNGIVPTGLLHAAKLANNRLMLLWCSAVKIADCRLMVVDFRYCLTSVILKYLEKTK